MHEKDAPRPRIEKVVVPWAAWTEDRLFKFALSSSLRVERLVPNDHNAWDDFRIQQAILNPVGCAAIRDTASACKTACIAVDDLARPTPAFNVLPILLSELFEAGIEPRNSVIVIATGTHGRISKEQIELKIGRAAMRSGVEIEVHDQSKLVGTGIQYGKQELRVNESFLKADFKLGVSSVLPHSFAGYSGGAKMMLPGLADIDATMRSHKFVQMGLRSGESLNENRFRSEIECIARQLGFHFTVCMVCNQSREAVGVFAGDVVAAHRIACKMAAKCYETPFQGRFDAMILNAYPKDMDLVQSENALIAFKQSGLDMVDENGLIVICTAAKAMGVHGLFAPNGASYRTPGPIRKIGSRELCILAPNLPEEIVRQKYWKGYRYCRDMVQLDRLIAERLRPNARIGVLPAAPMQQLVRIADEGTA